MGESMNRQQAKRAAFLPLIGNIVLSVLLIYYAMMSYYYHSDVNNFLLLTIVVLFFAVPIYTFSAMILFLIKLAKLSDISEGKQILWGILLFMFNAFVFPIFWYIHIYKKEPDAPQTGRIRRSKEQVISDWKFTRKRKAEIRKKRKLEEQIERKERAYIRKQMVVSIFQYRWSWFLAFAPIILFILCIILVAYILIFGTKADYDYDLFFLVLAIIRCLFVFFVICNIIMIILFAVQVFINKRLNKSQKVVWIILLITLNMIVFPVYWIRHIHIKKI